MGSFSRSNLRRLIRRRSGSASAELSDDRLDELLEAYFDREAGSGASRELFARLEQDEHAQRRFLADSGMLDAVRRSTREIDLSASVLDEVGRRRGWTTDVDRRVVTIGRLAAAACLLLALGAGFSAQRFAPDAFDLSGQDQPVSNLVRAASLESQPAAMEPLAQDIDDHAPDQLIRKRRQCATGCGADPSAVRSRSASFTIRVQPCASERGRTPGSEAQGRSTLLFISAGAGVSDADRSADAVTPSLVEPDPE